jgi:hypothetical protein
MVHTRYELRLRAPIAHTLLDLIRTRFDHVTTPGADGTLLIIENIDQASVRALLTLLWDTGHEVLSFEEMNHQRPIS